MLHTMQSGTTQESTGFASLSTSTGNWEDWLLPERNIGVYEGRDICTTRHVLQEGQPGRGTTHSLFVAIVNAGGLLSFFIFLLYYSVLFFFFFFVVTTFKFTFWDTSWVLAREFAVVSVHLKLRWIWCLWDEMDTYVYSNWFFTGKFHELIMFQKLLLLFEGLLVKSENEFNNFHWTIHTIKIRMMIIIIMIRRCLTYKRRIRTTCH